MRGFELSSIGEAGAQELSVLDIAGGEVWMSLASTAFEILPLKWSWELLLWQASTSSLAFCSSQAPHWGSITVTAPCSIFFYQNTISVPVV